jgi:peptidoglycan/LPS O-acetylase OafA/YrhL
MIDQINRNKITYLNFIMAFFIIWHHTYNVNVYDLQGGLLYWFEKFTVNAFDVSVSLFFALSGFLFYQNLNKDNLKKKLLSRIRGLVIPYIVWNILGFIYFQLLALFPTLRQYYGGEIEPFSIGVLLDAIINYKYNLVTWYLRTLIIYTFLMPILYPAFKNKNTARVLFIISILISCYGVSIQNDDLMNISFYCLGVICGIHYKDMVLCRYNNKLKVTCLCLFVLLIIVNLYMGDSFYGSIYYVFIRLLSVICMWIIFDILAIETKPKQWMKYSFVMYVSHTMVLEPIEKIIFLLLGNNIVGASIDYFVAPLLTTFVICSVCFILEKINLYKYFSGGR